MNVNRSFMDTDHEVYEFAGGLLGSSWEFPNGRVATVVGVSLDYEREQGYTLPYPDLRFDIGPRLPAEGFMLRVDPAVGDVYPRNAIAESIVEALAAADQ